MRSVTGGLLEALDASSLDVPDLTADEPAALHVVPEFSQRPSSSHGIKAADAKPRQRCLHPVDDPALFADEAVVPRFEVLGALCSLP